MKHLPWIAAVVVIILTSATIMIVTLIVASKSATPPRTPGDDPAVPAETSRPSERPS